MIKKLYSLFISLFIVVSLTFILMHSIPGDPFTDERALPTKIHEALRNHYGLDDPLYDQYVKYLKSVFTLNLGPSLKYQHKSVNSVIKDNFPISALLGLEALFIAISLGVFFGVVAAIRNRSWQNYLFAILSSLGISIPSFILAVFLQYIFAMKLDFFPIARWGTISHTILPALSLAAVPAAYISRLVRCNMIETLKSDYIKTAISKGLPLSRIIFKHALKNSLSPLMPYFGQLSANILLGSFVIEKIFGIPGLGFWFVNSVNNRDYSMILGLTLFYSFILLFLLFIADVIHSFLDPRIRVNK